MKVRNPSEKELEMLKKLLLKYGDIPPEEATIATKKRKRKQWLVVIEKGKILGAGRVYKTDWYEWTVKNAFVIPSARGKGVASMLYAKLTDKAENEGAKVCEADITATNIASKLAASRAGMVPVNSFKWDKKETHADIYQEVFMPPTKKEVNIVNKYIDKQFELKDKNVPLNIYSPFSLTSKRKKR